MLRSLLCSFTDDNDMCVRSKVLFKVRMPTSPLLRAVQCVRRLVRHLRVAIAEMLSGIHAERTCTTAEAVALRSVFAAVALFAERRAFVQTHCGAVQHAVAQAALQTMRMPLLSTSQLLFGGEHRLAAFWARFLHCGSPRHVCRLLLNGG